MKTYGITIPIAGMAYIQIETNSEKEAIEKAFNDITNENIEEWECFEHISQGNVLYAPYNDITVDLIND